MPQFAIIIYADGHEGTQEELAEHDKHAEDLIREGALTGAYALAANEAAKAVREDGVTDGPYIETKELIAGIGIVEADDLDAALAIARRNPATWQGAGVEVREVIGSYIRP
ncbi:YciI family protein [uncultured Leifsonia sp.]|uniref:YciI family protein n=1 Tax=Leifsonia sp. TaxID=1870902 RepID=UPI0028D4C779|nr:YciI family protein [uncultured Leifsonia sp.]